MTAVVVPLTEAHFHQLHAVLDEVAREKRYLAMLQAPPREQTFAFLRDSLNHRNPHVVALLDEQVVGWCDVLPVRADNRNARELYERLGFQHEGRQYGTFQVDGEAFDSHARALLRDGPR